jgi:hypothetical protein
VEEISSSSPLFAALSTLLVVHFDLFHAYCARSSTPPRPLSVSEEWLRSTVIACYRPTHTLSVLQESFFHRYPLYRFCERVGTFPLEFGSSNARALHYSRVLLDQVVTGFSPQTFPFLLWLLFSGIRRAHI